MYADSMQVVPTESQQRASEQHIANNSLSGNVFASLHLPVPHQGGPFLFFTCLKLHKRLARMAPRPARGTETSCASHLAPGLLLG